MSDDTFRCDYCGTEHDGTHHCSDPPGRTPWRQTKAGFETVDSVEEAEEMIRSIEHEETMLTSVVQGDGLLAGNRDELRSYGRREDRIQVQPPLIGQCQWSDVDDVAEDIYEKQLPVRVVDWEDRV